MKNQHTPSKLGGRLLVLSAALMWSSAGLFAKAPIFGDWDPATRGLLLAFWRAAFAAMLLAPLIRRPRWNILLVPMSLCFTLMCVSYLSAITLTTAANAIWLQNTAPAWVFMISVLALREPIVRRDMIPLCFAVLGVGTILLFEAQGQALPGVACGIASGLTYGCVIVFTRLLRRHDAVWLVGLNHLVATALLLPWMLSLRIWPSPGQLAVLAAFGVFQMAIPYVLISRGLRAISSQEAVAIALLEPVLMPLWVFLVWREVPAWWTILGAVLILVGLVVRYAAPAAR